MGQAQSSTDMAIVTQNLERMQFAKELQANPAAYNQYVNTRVNELSKEVYNRKRTAFQKVQIDMGRYMDLDHNANYYKERSGDVNKLIDVIYDSNKKMLGELEHDKLLTKRQFEINEWYNYNKLETLFFLQVFFIASLTMAIIIFLGKNNTITSTMAGLLTGILVSIVAIIAFYRYFYTARTRDTRLWNRRYFPKSAKPPPAPKCNPDGTVSLELPKSKCLDQAAAGFNDWQKGVQDQMLAYQTTGATSSVAGNLDLASCSNS